MNLSRMNMALAVEMPIEVFGKTLRPKYAECQEGFVEMSSNHINTGIVVVPDEVVDDVVDGEAVAAEDATGVRWVENTLIGNYNFSGKEEVREFEERLNGLAKSPVANEVPLPDGVTKLSIREATVGLSAMVTFIGLYVGLVFLMASATILALKELSESSDNRERYGVLRKIGLTKR